jgi:hypothetical protein
LPFKGLGVGYGNYVYILKKKILLPIFIEKSDFIFSGLVENHRGSPDIPTPQ